MLTIYDWFGYALPIRDRYRLIKEAGFDGVLLWWSDLLDRGDYRKGPQIAREEYIRARRLEALSTGVIC